MTTIRTITVIGAGTMGNGIAHVAAAGGYRTLLFDTDAAALETSRTRIHGNLDKGVSRGKLSEEAAARAKELLVTQEDLAVAVADSDLVVEAVPESVEVKIDVFRLAQEHAPERAIFASNTSGLSVTEIAGATDRADRFAGMHFFNPVHIMKLVEIVRGLETSEETLQAITGVAVRMGKEVVLVNESPGFVTSRVNAMIGNEAFRMLEAGVATADDIDKALKLGLNHPMGPFEMVDLVGLDVRLSILEYLHSTLGETYRPANLLRRYVKAGRLGRKVGKGVYSYDEEGRRMR